VVVKYLCLKVPDVAKAGEILAGRTLRPECRPPTPMKTGVNRKRQINFFDPDGTRIEITETTPWTESRCGRPIRPLRISSPDPELMLSFPVSQTRLPSGNGLPVASPLVY
jgi:lactoylglutathione lyase